MEFENLISIIQAVSLSELTCFQYEEKGIKLKLTKEKSASAASAMAPGQSLVGVGSVGGQDQSFASAGPAGGQGQPLASAGPAGGQSQPQAEPEDSQAAGRLVLSPLVGTFYVAPAEDADPFVAVGDTVKKGQILAIVEAMKLMNEIESEFDGVVEEVLVENGQPVEYHQPLFRLK